ncbi:B3 domain-containing protein [Hordeum vulgare]|nr:B3 domain-containing protein [Hordeum vulgare]
MAFEFFTIVLSNSLRKQRLPDKFAKVFHGHEPRELMLREAGRRRRLWAVDVVFDADGHMYLGHGWKQFACAHDLRLGHFLLLSYDGHAVLTIKVFDTSMCRRDYEYDDETGSGSSSDSGNTLGAEGEWAEEHDMKQGVSSMNNPCDSDGSQKERSYSSEELSDDILSVDNSVHSANIRTLSDNYAVSARCYLTKAQKVKIVMLIDKIRPKFKVLVLLMKKSNIRQHTLVIPKDYALKYFPCESTSIIFQLPSKNKTWNCRMSISPSGVCNPGEEISDSAHEDEGDSHDSEGASEPLFVAPDRPRLTDAQKKKVLEKVRSIDSELPIWVMVMNNTSVRLCKSGAYLNMGKKYVSRYLVNQYFTGRHGKKNVMSLVLEREGKNRKWHTELRLGSDGAAIVKGWMSFARDNQLQVDDLCLFKLMRDEDFEETLKMMVYIIRHKKCSA